MRKLLFSAALLLIYHLSNSQITHKDYWNRDDLPMSDSSKNEIDPRRYVRVLYKKNPNYKYRDGLEVQRVIWHWNDSSYFQKFKVLDNEGLLYIYFKKEELSKNYNFQGNISLEAFIKGKDGERKIEVGPYSLVGVNRTEYGIESFPPTTVAQLLFNTIIEMKKTIVSVDFNKYDTIYASNEDYVGLLELINSISESHKNNLSAKIDTSESSYDMVRYYAQNYNKDYPSLLKYFRTPTNSNYTDLLRDLAPSAVISFGRSLVEIE